MEKASRQAVEYAKQFENPVLMMEDLTHIRERLDYGKYMNRRLHCGRSPDSKGASRTRRRKQVFRSST